MKVVILLMLALIAILLVEHKHGRMKKAWHHWVIIVCTIVAIPSLVILALEKVGGSFTLLVSALSIPLLNLLGSHLLQKGYVGPGWPQPQDKEKKEIYAHPELSSWLNAIGTSVLPSIFCELLSVFLFLQVPGVEMSWPSYFEGVAMGSIKSVIVYLIIWTVVPCVVTLVLGWFLSGIMRVALVMGVFIGLLPVGLILSGIPLSARIGFGFAPVVGAIGGGIVSKFVRKRKGSSALGSLLGKEHEGQKP